MADVGGRRDYRSGGGGGYNRGYNKRKRGREDDDFDGQPYRNQRQRQDIPPGTRIKKGLLEIGEDQLRLPHEVAVNLARLTAENYEDDYVKQAFSTVALKLIREQPFKIPFVAGVVLFANTQKSEIAKDVIAKAAAELQELLEQGQWRETKLVLRFLACLGQLFEQDGVLPILDELFNRAVDLQTASPDDTVGPELVKIILLTVPYLLAFAPDQVLQQRASELLEKTAIIASTPMEVEALVDPYPTLSEDVEKPVQCVSIMSLLQNQLQEEAQNGWPLACILRVYDPASKPGAKLNGDSNGETNGDATDADVKHAFPTVTVPSTINPGTKPLFPELYFSLYADQDVESVPPTSSIASTLMRDAIVDTINGLDFNRNQTAKYLNEIDCFWTNDTFVKRATPFDKLRDMEPGRPTWKPEDIIIDAVFSQIFTLPTPEHRLVYYHSLITESCKISPAAIAPSLGRAIRFMFRTVDVMDLELAYRYMDWFAHHLSNFEFRWKWAEWIPEVALTNLNPKKAFINGVLDKEIRLSFAKRIRETLPEEYHPLIPTSKEQDIPNFKYKNDTTPFASEGREVLALLKKKAPEEEIQRVLDSVHEQARAAGVDPLVASTDIYMTSILSIGAKSLSHVLSTVDRCKDRLLALGPENDQARRQIISSVVDFWADHPGTAVNIVDKLLNYTIVTPMSVVQWALVDQIQRGRALANVQIYELISITMFKVTNRLHQLLEHRANVSLDFDQRLQIDQALPRERQSMRDLFAAIEDAVAAVASGVQDEMIERFDDGSSEQDVIQQWGARWAKAWRRKSAVEEALLGENAVPPLGEPPVKIVDDEAGAGGDENMDQIS